MRHGSEQAQQVLLWIKLRDSLVRARLSLINSVRFSLKSLGYAVVILPVNDFNKWRMENYPQRCGRWLLRACKRWPSSVCASAMLECEITDLVRTKYPQALLLQQIPGVGALTALYFVLKIEDPKRFNNVRDVGAYAGLCPGAIRAERAIRDCASPSAAMPTCAGCWSVPRTTSWALWPESALRDYGLKLAADGTARAKKRAVVAVARKLCVLLLSLWKNQTPTSFPQRTTLRT